MQLGLFSISYAGLWGQAALDLRQFVRHAAELGFDAVMLAGKRPHLSPLDADEAAVAGLRQDLQASGLRCPVVAAYTDLGAAVATEVPFLEMQLAYVESLCRVGAKLGAKFVRVFTAYESSAQNAHALWQRTVTTLRGMADRAERAGAERVTVTVPKQWRTRAAITWGNGGRGVFNSVRFTGCGSNPDSGDAYAGGFYLASASACLPLVFRVGTRTATVRFGIGRECR